MTMLIFLRRESRLEAMQPPSEVNLRMRSAFHLIDNDISNFNSPANLADPLRRFSTYSTCILSIRACWLDLDKAERASRYSSTTADQRRTTPHQAAQEMEGRVARLMIAYPVTIGDFTAA
jgi:hypothetical protein